MILALTPVDPFWGLVSIGCLAVVALLHFTNPRRR